MKNFKCKRCGDCCYTPRLTKKDILRMKKAGLKDFVFTDNFGVKYIKEKNGKCMFLKCQNSTSFKKGGLLHKPQINKWNSEHAQKPLENHCDFKHATPALTEGFLTQGNKATCTIHLYRAEICRQYPTCLNNGSCKPVEFSFDKYLKERKK